MNVPAPLMLPLEAKRLDVNHSCIYDATGALVVPKMLTEQQNQRAYEIARRVNAHDDLVAALKEIAALGDAWPTPSASPLDYAVRIARAALAKAEG